MYELRIGTTIGGSPQGHLKFKVKVMEPTPVKFCVGDGVILSRVAPLGL
jgi:hypothetical protein